MSTKYEHMYNLISYLSAKLDFINNKNYIKQIYHNNGTWTIVFHSFNQEKGKDIYCMSLYPKKREVWLGNTKEREVLPISLCKQIRNNINTKKKSFVNFVNLVEDDRTIVISIGSDEERKFLVFELYADGNLCIVDKHVKIIGLTRKYIDREEKETTKVGSLYRLDLQNIDIYSKNKEIHDLHIHMFEKKIREQIEKVKKPKNVKISNAIDHQRKNKKDLEYKSEFFKETAKNMELSMYKKKSKEVNYDKIQEWYNKKKAVDKKLEGATLQIESREKVEKVEKVVKEKKIEKIIMRDEYYHEFIWFYTSRGNLVIGGKNASQSEKIVKKYMTKYCRYFHCELGGSGSFLWIPSSLDELGEDKEMREVADTVLIYSTHKTGRVYWIKPFNEETGKAQVSKTAPTGLSLGGKGSFMVTGKGEKNYVPTISLDVGVVIIERTKYNKEVMIAPYRVVKEIKGTKIKIFDNGEQLNRKKLNKILKKNLNLKMIDGLNYPNFGGITIVKK